MIAEEVARRHRKAYPVDGLPPAHRALEIGGEYQWRREGEPHLFDPETVFRLQHATRAGRYDVFKQYTARVDEQSERLMTLRGLFAFKDAEAIGRPSIPIEEVEPVSEIVKRFSTGAMSYGSISQEAHETLAIAMNRLGGKSNTGEGGEDADRLYDPERRSAIKQVASGRFGVTSEYLTNADDIQIKMAQGAKPGEGGQLPGHKVYPWVAKTRHSTPGVGLISPPPHHDIYSIEDLAQLIHDLKNANPSRAGARQAGRRGRRRHGRRRRLQGARRRGADLRSRRRHRRGAAHLAQARRRAVGARPRRDPADAAAQRAARPHRRAGRRPAEDRPRRHRRRAARRRGVRLRDRAAGRLGLHHDAGLPPRHLPGGRRHPEPRAARALRRQARVRRELLRVHRRGGARAPRRARLPHPRRGGRPRRGARRRARPSTTGRPPGSTCADPARARAARGRAAPPHHAARTTASTRRSTTSSSRWPRTPSSAASRCAPRCRSATSTAPSARSSATRSPSATGARACPTARSTSPSPGSAGQSFGAFLPRGITLRLEGDANDYVGKGLSGGRIVVRPDRAATFAAEEQIIAGNVIGYGATSGEIFLRGQVGERFCVRNSGATAVVEGVGDHGCEYMTGGRVVVLGPTGRNFAAGMSGGVAFVLDLDDRPGQPGARRARRRSTATPPTSSRPWSAATSRRPARRWPRRCSPTGRTPYAGSPR